MSELEQLGWRRSEFSCTADFPDIAWYMPAAIGIWAVEAYEGEGWHLQSRWLSDIPEEVDAYTVLDYGQWRGPATLTKMALMAHSGMPDRIILPGGKNLVCDRAFAYGQDRFGNSRKEPHVD